MTEKRTMMKRKKISKPNSGNTKGMETNKITQYFFIEKPTDKGIGEGRLKGKARERVNIEELTHKCKQGDRTNYDRSII